MAPRRDRRSRQTASPRALPPARDGGATANTNKKKNKRRRRSKKNPPQHETPIENTEPSPPPPPQQVSKRRKKDAAAAAASNPSASLFEKMRSRLSGGHFRMLNEKLYTCSGNDAFNLFKEDPELFNVYHAGYQEQMSHWPQKPVNSIIKWLKDHNPSLIVADFGCGDASLAKNVKNKVFSIDLVSNDPSVIACDMSHTPLETSSIDVAVFCLSLMGTNFSHYLEEANRVLRPRGWLLIAEVKSRFDPQNGGADPDRFIKAMQELGLTLISKDLTNKMFVLFFFKKEEKCNYVRKEIKWPSLKPCLYKRR
ncbi:Ribosomal RNA-processing protein 8 [Acorus gramineus]|uniref:Ribosomal RNA-processing protein 8 n=1 Tax=Acorus gramineus TaxID=55184 RepID=A0AAV9B5C7_ACOGR|nr:Ribosomal RNA-processing protein 8 [Acorus gramineus]